MKQEYNKNPIYRVLYLFIGFYRFVGTVIGIVLKEKRPLQDFQYEILSALLNEAGVRTRDIFLL
ncbi:hypothetical protein FBG61_05410 [Campylobacter jejuni]|nr:hypothetical protein [Campylobacter jejuni]